MQYNDWEIQKKRAPKLKKFNIFMSEVINNSKWKDDEIQKHKLQFTKNPAPI